MRVGLHCLFWPINLYPDGSLHPAPYDGSQLEGEILRSPLQPTSKPADDASRAWWSGVCDQWVDAVIAAGRTPILILDAAQPWLADQIAARHAGKGVVYEIGNECSDPPFWSGTADDYAAALTQSYNAIKAADSQAIVITAGLQGMQNGGRAMRWLHQVLERSPHFDGVGVHLYPGEAGEVDLIPEMLSNLRSVLWAHRRETAPIWNTESGILKPRFRGESSYSQTDLIRRMFRHARDCFASVWYAFDHHDMGLGVTPEEFPQSVSTWNAAVP